MNRHAMAGKEAVRRRRRIGEVAGGTAAACAAVWCCCPCAAVSVLVLALYKVPAGVCRRAWDYRNSSQRRNKKKKKKKKNRRSGMGHDGLLLDRRPIGASVVEVWDPTLDVADAELDHEMWGRFSTSGFWRSPSQRDE